MLIYTLITGFQPFKLSIDWPQLKKGTPGPEIIKHCTCSIQLSMKFHLLMKI